MKKLSVVAPCYNEAENIRDFYAEVMKTKPFFTEKEVALELYFIDDGSTDETADAVKELRKADDAVRLVRFSRNFGKEAAIYAGLEKAQGDFVAIIDCDLQDPPSLLPEMYTAITEEGYDSVATRRVTRKGEPAIRSFFARMFYRLINRMSGTQIVDGARDYRMMTRQFADAILEVTEYNRFSKGIFSWVGFQTKWLEFENIARKKGETKWSFWKLVAYALDGIVAFTTVPLAIASITGVVFFLLAIFFLIVVWARAMIYGDPTPGWPSLVCIILLISGVQLFCIGVVGEYLAKTYVEVKKRPIYIEREEL